MNPFISIDGGRGGGGGSGGGVAPLDLAGKRQFIAEVMPVEVCGGEETYTKGQPNNAVNKAVRGIVERIANRFDLRSGDELGLWTAALCMELHAVGCTLTIPIDKQRSETQQFVDLGGEGPQAMKESRPYEIIRELFYYRRKTRAAPSPSCVGYSDNRSLGTFSALTHHTNNGGSAQVARDLTGSVPPQINTVTSALAVGDIAGTTRIMHTVRGMITYHSMEIETVATQFAQGMIDSTALDAMLSYHERELDRHQKDQKFLRQQLRILANITVS